MEDELDALDRALTKYRGARMLLADALLERDEAIRAALKGADDKRRAEVRRRTKYSRQRIFQIEHASAPVGDDVSNT